MTSSYFVPNFCAVVLNLSQIKLGLIASAFYLGSSFSGVIYPYSNKIFVGRSKYVLYYLLMSAPMVYEIFLTKDTNMWLIFALGFISGIGISCLIINALVMLSNIPPLNLKPIYLGLYSFIITSGVALSSSILSTIYTNFISGKIKSLIILNPTLESLIIDAFNDSSIVFSPSFSPLLRDQILDAYTVSTSRTLIVAACMPVLSFIFILFA
ncbi:hypothetical protein AYI69_g5099 [Smittium culicis]|uniref:Uncharacterized protein n=1 Tax=Smittium culicis TaxID=133412 RepID=A0A1R1Y845_9FUNG|nr:hypothetical protein AYI69_g5099 [Smittium culicis]